MIIVLDTNILVAGILKPYSNSASILRLVAEGIVQVAYDLRIFTEYRDVLTRAKFKFPHEAINDFLAQLEREGILVSSRPLKIHLPDPDDEPFLEVALASRALAIITGNKRHFPRDNYEKIKISSPAEFVYYLRKRL